jgi:ankyrin repeat protein
VSHYQHDPRSGLQHRLADWLPGSLAPPETRLHGTENLLHRACTEGNGVVVTELLSMGYRNLAAKNHESQTALHLASYHGHATVAAQLVKYGARVHCSDNKGDATLHMACQANRWGWEWFCD